MPTETDEAGGSRGTPPQPLQGGGFLRAGLWTKSGPVATITTSRAVHPTTALQGGLCPRGGLWDTQGERPWARRGPALKTPASPSFELKGTSFGWVVNKQGATRPQKLGEAEPAHDTGRHGYTTEADWGGVGLGPKPACSPPQPCRPKTDPQTPAPPPPPPTPPPSTASPPGTELVSVVRQGNPQGPRGGADVPTATATGEGAFPLRSSGEMGGSPEAVSPRDAG